MANVRNTQVVVKMTDQEKEELKRLASSQHTTISNLIRMTFLNDGKVKFNVN